MEELRYLKDHKLHTDLGNAIPTFEKGISDQKEELRSVYKKMVKAKDPNAEPYKQEAVKLVEQMDSHLELMKRAYEFVDSHQCDSFSLRERVRIVVKQLTKNILKRDGDKFEYPEKLSMQQRDVMMNIIVKGLSIIEKETRLIEEKTEHEF